VPSSLLLHAFIASSNVVAEGAATNGISVSMMVQWLTYAALLKRRVVMATAVGSSQNLRKEMDTDAARDRASVVNAVRETRKTPRVLTHVSELEIARSWKCEEVMTR
jgi:hypothetical protein